MKTKIAKELDNCFEILKKKNADYSDLKKGINNLTMVEELGIASSTTGILVRMSDKIGRLRSLINKEDREIAEESLQDTLLDLANYALILEFTLYGIYPSELMNMLKKEIKYLKIEYTLEKIEKTMILHIHNPSFVQEIFSQFKNFVNKMPNDMKMADIFCFIENFVLLILVLKINLRSDC